ncbi:MAG: hypothetical protein ACLUI7_01805 [Coprococcus sp.]
MNPESSGQIKQVQQVLQSEHIVMDRERTGYQILMAGPLEDLADTEVNDISLTGEEKSIDTARCMQISHPVPRDSRRVS